MRLLGIGRKARKRLDLDPIRIFTPLVELQGFVAPTGQRITDILLRGEELSFLPAGADATPDNWLLVAPADVLVVIPPPLPRRPAWMEAVEPVPIVVEIGRNSVTGRAHLRRGEPANETLSERHPFLPMTDATISWDGVSEAVDVAIVNLNASGRIDLAV
jgi:hypothetical protein